MPKGNADLVWQHLHDTVYAGTTTTDLTTLLTKRMNELTQKDVTARLIAIIAAAGGKN